MNFMTLLLTFFGVGILTIGGGLVSIPLLYQAFVTSGVMEANAFYQFVSIAESTPGPIAINLATYLGFVQLGWIGAFLATGMFILPSYALIEWFYPWFMKHTDLPYLKAVVHTLKFTVIGLIGLTLIRVVEHAIEDITDRPFVALGAFFSIGIFFYFNQKRPILVIGLSALIGMLLLA